VATLTIAGGSFALKDSARLRQFGLLELPSTIAHSPVDDVMRIFFEKYYQGDTENQDS
jgi:hypothetical protein